MIQVCLSVFILLIHIMTFGGQTWICCIHGKSSTQLVIEEPEGAEDAGDASEPEDYLGAAFGEVRGAPPLADADI